MTSKWKNRPDGRTVRRNTIPPGQQWSWWTREMLESPAWRVMSLSARRIVDRIRIELAHHAGKDNGKLPVTFRDFHDYGVDREAISPAVREAIALGFIRMTQYGVASNAQFRVPSLFAVTHLPTNDDQTRATDDWQRIKTVEEATAIARAARKALPRYARFPKKRRPEKTDLRSENPTEPGSENPISTAKILDRKTRSLSGRKTRSLSISREGERSERQQPPNQEAPHQATPENGSALASEAIPEAPKARRVGINEFWRLKNRTGRGRDDRLTAVST
jgi:hypothetical protein